MKKCVRYIVDSGAPRYPVNLFYDVLLVPFGPDWTALHPVAIPVLLFCLRAGDLTLATLRMLNVIRGRMLTSWLLGFFQAGFFVLGAAGLLGNLTNPLNLLAYAGGYATGNVIGLTLENRLIPGHTLLRIISSHRSSAIIEALRQTGWGATEVSGRGLAGTVGTIYCYTSRRAVKRARQLILATDAEAFVTAQPVRSLHGGWPRRL